MGWNNPPVSWAQLERALSGAPLPAESALWKRRQAPPLPERTPGPVVPYAELHVHSHYSVLDGASSPEQLVAEATRLGLHGIGLTDHDGLYGIVRMAEAAEVSTLKTVFGAELSLGLSKPQNGEPDPEGDHLVVLARKAEGYHRLAGAITTAQLDTEAEKGRPVYDLDALAAAATRPRRVVSGFRKGAVRGARVK
jgi:error-prone DNA polymerase